MITYLISPPLKDLLQCHHFVQAPSREGILGMAWYIIVVVYLANISINFLVDKRHYLFKELIGKNYPW
jgi:hypothetical protein